MDQLYMHKVLPHIQCMARKRNFFLFVCHMKFTSPFQFHAPLLFIENLPTVPYGQVHETTYLLHQIRSWEYGHDLGNYLYLTVGTSLMGQAQVKWGGEIRDTCSWVRCA